jgi:hypothetical protein
VTVTLLPFEPYYEGSIASASEVPSRLPVGIGGRGYVIDVPRYQRETIDALRPPQDTGEQPGDRSLNTVGVWRQVISDWAYGAGQAFLDAADATQRRYRSSKGVDPSEDGILKLLHDTASLLASSSAAKCLAIGTRLYVSDGSDLKFAASDTFASPTVVAQGDTIRDFTTDGDRYFCAIGTDIKTGAIGSAGAPTTFSTYDAQLVQYALGRLIAAKTGELAEISATGVATAIQTPFNQAAVFVAIVPAPTGIFVAYNTGDRGEFLYIGINAATGALATALPAGELNDGEFIYAMAYYQGNMVLGTSRGIRVADIVQDRGLSPGPAIEVGGAVRCLEPQAEFCWFGWTNYDTGSTGLGRLDLSLETEPNVPAYWSDLMATTQGNVISVCSFNDKRYFIVSGIGFYGESADLVPSGQALSGALRFDTFERKITVSVDVRHEPLEGTVALSVVNEMGTETAAGTSSTQGSLGPPSTFSTNDANGESLDIRVTLNRDADVATLGPRLQRWTLRSLTVPERTDSIMLPIIMKQKVMTPNRGETTYDPLDEWRFLKSLEASRTPTLYQEGHNAETVIVDKVQVAPEMWSNDIHWFEGIIWVRLYTLAPTGG